MRGWIFRLSLVLASTALCALMMEVGLRVYDAWGGNSSNARTSWYWLYEQDPNLGYRGRPHAIRRRSAEVIVHNADGFRDDRDLADLGKISPRRLVVCVGESSTYGASATDNGSTYPARLESELRSLTGDPRWVVFNAGVPGYTSHEILGLVSLRLLKLSPEAIVTMSLRNDLEFQARTLGDEQDYNFYPLRMAPLSRSRFHDGLMTSSLYGFFAGRLRGWWVDDLGGRPPAEKGDGLTARGLKFYLDNLAMTALACRRSGVRFFCVDQPVDVRNYTPERRRALATMRASLARFCAEGGVGHLEADARLDWKGLKPSDDVHIGDVGYQRLAALLAPQILAALARPEPQGDLTRAARTDGEGALAVEPVSASSPEEPPAAPPG